MSGVLVHVFVKFTVCVSYNNLNIVRNISPRILNLFYEGDDKKKRTQSHFYLIMQIWLE